MKKLVFTLAIVILSSCFAFGQLGFKGGIGLTTQAVSYNNNTGTEPEVAVLPAWQLGVFFSTPGKGFFFQSGLQFTRKGGQWETAVTTNAPAGPTTSRSIRKYTLNYIETPLNIGRKFNKGAVQVYAGPVISFGLGGEDMYENTTSGPSANSKEAGTNKVRFKKVPQSPSGSDEYRNPLDIGINMGVNFVMKSNLFVGFNANIGISNSSPKYEQNIPGYSREDTKIKNVFFGVNVGYILGKK